MNKSYWIFCYECQKDSELLEFFFQGRWMLYDFILIFKLNKNLQNKSNLYIIMWITQWIECAYGKKMRKSQGRRMSRYQKRNKL